MSTDAVILHLALAAAGIGAGFLNTIAGGGSMMTLPVLMMLGLPADVANGTNRLSIVTQSLSGALGYHRGGKLDTGAAVPILLPTVAGAIAGAITAANVPPDILKYVLLGTMISVAAVMALVPKVITGEADSEPAWNERRVTATIALFGAGLYGGFVQAGVGFVLLSVLGGVLRYDMVRANALKLVCVLGFGTAALVVFIIAGQVAWLLAVLLAIYTVIGSQLGVRYALNTNPRRLRWIIFAAVVAASIGAVAKA